MTLRLTLTDQTSTGRETGTVELEGVSATLTLRDLIRTRVREEVAKHNAGPPNHTFRGLVMPAGAEPVDGGVQTAPGSRISWEEQADVAIEAFGRNGFFVLVDGRQATELDESLSLNSGSDVRFVRLVALEGG